MAKVPRCKCILIGDASTGKTSIVQRFLEPNQVFKTKYNMTTGVNISFKQVKINNKIDTVTNDNFPLANLSNLPAKKISSIVSFDDEENHDNLIELFIYDICGKSIYFDLLKNICNNVSMVIGVYDVCRIDSFKKLQNLLGDLMKQFHQSNDKNNLIDEHQNLNNSKFPPAVGVILGNKIDKISEERRIVDEEAQQLAKKYKFAYYECSAKKNIGIEEVFSFLSAKYIEQFLDDQ